MTSHVPEAGFVVAAATAASEAVVPDASWIERLGTVGLLVVVLGIAVQYLVKQLAKKDEQSRVEREAYQSEIRSLSVEATRAADRNTAVLVAELRASHQVEERMTAALHELTATLRDRSRTA